MVNILAFSGSLRTDSFNKKLLSNAVRGAQQAGAEVTVVDLKEYPIPIYDGDIEASSGLPENVLKLKALFSSHEGFLIACPEYNGSYSGALKNVIDWVSRPIQNEGKLAAFKGKVVAIMSASPGGMGGMRMLPQLRYLLSSIHCTVLTDQLALGGAASAFDGDRIVDDAKRVKAEELGKQVVEMVEKLVC